MSDNGTPWDADLETAFADPEIREQVSAFLGEKIQPYVTRVEQEARPNRDATRLWDELNERPDATTIQVVKELWGQETADEFIKVLEGGRVGAAAEEQDADVEEDRADDNGMAQRQSTTIDDLPPEIRELYAEAQQNKQREAYYSELERITAEHAEELPKDEDGNPLLEAELFHPFVAAADGDFDAAWNGYLAFEEQARKRFGIEVPNPEDIPPTVIDGETRDASATPPVEKDYEGDIGAAIDDFMLDQQTAPPTVGGV